MLAALGPRAAVSRPDGRRRDRVCRPAGGLGRVARGAKARARGLVVEHSIFRSRSQIGFADFNDEIFKQLPPVPQALVRHHPASGRTSLYLASHASHVIGWPVEKGRALVTELIAFATQSQFVYRHHWTVGDLVVWDNRCTMHRGRPYDDTQRRVLHRTTVSDYANTLKQEGLVAISAA
jgi:alpha-ketoglutarate-dependent 2,4-dichlorophenoxyacetate dioxygenase